MYYEDGYVGAADGTSTGMATTAGAASVIRALVGALVVYVGLGILYCIWIYTKTDTDANHDGAVTQAEFEAAVQASKLGRIFGPIATLVSSVIKHSEN